MSHELSDALSNLAVKTKKLEDDLAESSAENKQKLDARIAKAKAESEANNKKFIKKTEELKSNISSDLSKQKNLLTKEFRN